MMQDIFARHLGIPAANVRVIRRDVGGSFGMKLHIYPDEMATVRLSMLLGARSSSSPTASNPSSRTSTPAITGSRRAWRAAEGEILAIEIDDLTGIGPYSVYPRTSGSRATRSSISSARPIAIRNYRARAAGRVPEQECDRPVPRGRPSDRLAVTEGWSISAARTLGMDRSSSAAAT